MLIGFLNEMHDDMLSWGVELIFWRMKMGKYRSKKKSLLGEREKDNEKEGDEESERRGRSI